MRKKAIWWNFWGSILDRHYSIQECRTVKSKTQSTDFWMWGSQNQRPDKMTWIYSKSLNVTSFWTVKVTVKFQISRFPGYDVTAVCCGKFGWPKLTKPSGGQNNHAPWCTTLVTILLVMCLLYFCYPLAVFLSLLLNFRFLLWHFICFT